MGFCAARRRKLSRSDGPHQRLVCGPDAGHRGRRAWRRRARVNGVVALGAAGGSPPCPDRARRRLCIFRRHDDALRVSSGSGDMQRQARVAGLFRGLTGFRDPRRLYAIENEALAGEYFGQMGRIGICKSRVGEQDVEIVVIRCSAPPIIGAVCVWRSRRAPSRRSPVGCRPRCRRDRDNQAGHAGSACRRP